MCKKHLLNVKMCFCRFAMKVVKSMHHHKHIAIFYVQSVARLLFIRNLRFISSFNYHAHRTKEEAARKMIDRFAKKHKFCSHSYAKSAATIAVQFISSPRSQPFFTDSIKTAQLPGKNELLSPNKGFKTCKRHGVTVKERNIIEQVIKFCYVL